MLRWFLAILLAWGLLRVFRRVTASLSSPQGPRRRSLDPERAVRASWREEDDESAEPRTGDGR